MILFSSWHSLLRILIIGFTAYIGLILILRLSGNRTLSKMNSFDFIITIALGSTLASAILDQKVALLDVLLAFSVLIGLQYFATWASVHSSRLDRFLKSDPVLLFADGTFRTEAMMRAHVTREEVLAGMREQGYSTLDQVEFVVLEANGKIIAVQRSSSSAEKTLSAPREPLRREETLL